jgi:hypothetical protein
MTSSGIESVIFQLAASPSTNYTTVISHRVSLTQKITGNQQTIWIIFRYYLAVTIINMEPFHQSHPTSSLH